MAIKIVKVYAAYEAICTECYEDILNRGYRITIKEGDKEVECPMCETTAKVPRMIKRWKDATNGD